MHLSELERRIAPYGQIVEWRGREPEFVLVSDGDHKQQLGLFAGTLPLLTPDDALCCEGDLGRLRYSGGDVVIEAPGSSRTLYSGTPGKADSSWAPLDVSPERFTSLLQQGCDIRFNDSPELLAQQRDVEEQLRTETVREVYSPSDRKDALLAQAHALTDQRSDVMIADLLSNPRPGTSYQVVGRPHLGSRWYDRFTLGDKSFATVEITRPYARTPGARPGRG